MCAGKTQYTLPKVAQGKYGKKKKLLFLTSQNPHGNV